MRLIYLSTFWAIVIDFIVWFIIHIGVVSIMVRIPARHFDPNRWPYRGGNGREAGMFIRMF